MDTNTIVGMVGIASIALFLLVIFVVGLTTIVKKTKQVYASNTDSLITSKEAKVITDGQTALNAKLNKLSSKKVE